MKRLYPFALVALLTLSSATRAATDAEVEARRVALELAGAFSNDGFKLRDGYWSGRLEPGKAHVAQVNLYAGNQYWFTLGADAPARKLAVTIFDEAGKPMAVEPYAGGATAAAGFSPEASGPYYIRVEELDGAPATFCLIYSYK